MSEISKPENMNTSLKCPLNPDQYTFRGFSGGATAPTGSFAWALSHVYVKKQLLYRTGWHIPKEHIRLSHQSVANSEGDGTAYIEKSDKDGYWLPWKPTQEDLMACDWKILLLEPYWMSFDINSESSHIFDGEYHGYTTHEAKEFMKPYVEGFNAPFVPIGALSNLQNNININKVIAFASSISFNHDDERGYTHHTGLVLIITCDGNNCQKTLELLNRDIYVTIDNRIYRLYVSSPLIMKNNTISVGYNSILDPEGQKYADDSIDLFTILKRYIGKIKLSWLDK
ncbi:Thoeris anti-defense Tad2 family protein [Xenorhabdus taiwanensis]|uniref:Uncharacterized protein n=1 Tax=Xenorhabdus taiwanensis TaxID=3085177 RepID=A0ABM8K049_9GAMM|nr:hypothetical protein TCT1_32710 [Xenorhabdus sp. TCT-1]